MPSGRLYSDYDDLAWVYNKYWGDRFLPTALAALEKLALPHTSRQCGYSGPLLRHGPASTGTHRARLPGDRFDGSEEMLNFARENAPGASFILDDARTFTLPAAYHLAVSMFDSLNHVLTLGELTAVFSNVHAALLGGGLFVFDLNTEEGYKANWNGFSVSLKTTLSVSLKTVITRKTAWPNLKLLFSVEKTTGSVRM